MHILYSLLPASVVILKVEIFNYSGRVIFVQANSLLTREDSGRAGYDQRLLPPPDGLVQPQPHGCRPQGSVVLFILIIFILVRYYFYTHFFIPHILYSTFSLSNTCGQLPNTCDPIPNICGPVPSTVIFLIQLQ